MPTTQEENSGQIANIPAESPFHAATTGEMQAGDQESNEQEGNSYLKGWPLHFLTIGLWLALFLSTLESTIVSTSLVSIANALNGFRLRDWIVTSYLLTYTGFLVIFAKFGEVFGRKTMFLTSLAIFTLFSILCGAANEITTLIILRAFQGTGASGIFSMTMVIAPTLVPMEKFGKYIALVSTVFTVATVLGPILGGIINEHSTWRWVFLLNAPGGVFAIALLAFFLPSSRDSDEKLLLHVRHKFKRSVLRKIDVPGTVFLLAASLLLVFSLEEAETRYKWSSSVIITTLTLSVVLWMGFVAWELFLRRSSSPEPVFPLKILKDRLVTGMMLTALCIGFPFVSIVVNIPQRAQAVSGLSPLRSGLTLLPLLLSSPFATAISGVLTTNFKVPPFYLILLGSLLQLVGVGLTITLPTNTHHITKKQYGYQVIMGLGFGFGLSTIITLAPLLAEEADRAVTLGAVTQVRVLGGTVSLAICSTILNSHIRPKLSTVIPQAQLQAITDNLSAIEKLTPKHRDFVRTAFAEGYHKQNIFLTAISAVCLFVTMLLWEKYPRRVS